MKRYIVIEWDSGGDADDWEAGDYDGGAYEFAEETDGVQLHVSIELAKREAERLVGEEGAAWAQVLVGHGESWEDVDQETAELFYSYERKTK